MGAEEMDWEDVDQEIQDIPNAHFDVLDSSLPGYSSRKSPFLSLLAIANTILDTDLPNNPLSSSTNQ